jgi:transposase
MLSDTYWSKLRTIMRQENIYDKKNLRLIVEGLLYRLSAGYPWRNLPASYSHWNTVYKRFNEWSSKGKLMQIFKPLAGDPDLEWLFIDGSIVKVHQHSAGVASHESQGIDNSRGGKTTKIYMAVDGCSLPLLFKIIGGQVNDCVVALELIEALAQSDYVIADKGYDSKVLRLQIKAKPSIPVIPRKKHSTIGNEGMDWYLYKYYHLVETFSFHCGRPCKLDCVTAH